MPTAAALPRLPSAASWDPFAEGDLPEGCGLEEARLHWVSLDAQTGRLVCQSLGLETDGFTGRITEARLVRVFGDASGYDGEEVKEEEDKDEDGSVLCASENRQIADHGRPGRECRGCEDISWCTPRWRIIWKGYGNQCYGDDLPGDENPGDKALGIGLTFAHTLSAAGTLLFTRYRLALRREGLLPQEVLTRIAVESIPVEKARQPRGKSSRWRIRFERIDFERAVFKI